MNQVIYEIPNFPDLKPIIIIFVFCFIFFLLDMERIFYLYKGIRERSLSKKKGLQTFIMIVALSIAFFVGCNGFIVAIISDRI